MALTQAKKKIIYAYTKLVEYLLHKVAISAATLGSRSRRILGLRSRVGEDVEAKDAEAKDAEVEDVADAVVVAEG
jgi:hypothetical protein